MRALCLLLTTGEIILDICSLNVLLTIFRYDMEFSGPLFPTSAFIRDISLANTSQATQRSDV